MSNALGRINCAYNVWNNPEDPDYAYALAEWVLGRLDSIQSTLPALYQCIYHRLDFAYPAMGVSTALEEIKSIVAMIDGDDDSEDWSSDESNAMSTMSDIADLIVTYHIDS